jgi:transcriptional regulator with PAS, ATPase and Fis domain
MKEHNWVKSFPAAITVCNEKGTITEMNKESCKVFESDGGINLIGSNLLDCHPEPSKTELKELMQEKRINVYTIEKNGKKKLIYQSPVFENGEFKGYVELSLPLPHELRHFIRK